MRIIRLALAVFAATLAFVMTPDSVANPSGKVNPLRKRPVLDVPYVPTRQEVVDKMLELANVGPYDYLIDLGSGDGRIPITAAGRFGTRGLGVDINPLRIAEANSNAKEQGVADKVEFRKADLFKTDFSKATVLTMYLLPTINLKLRPIILDTLKPGTRVVSNTFDMDDWLPDRTAQVDSAPVYFWLVPARVQGTWQMSDTTAPEKKITVRIEQQFQNGIGDANIDGKAVPLRSVKLAGEMIRFEIAAKEGRTVFEGLVNRNTMEGDGWKATRLP